MTVEATELVRADAAAIREAALTPEQRRRRAEVARRTAVVQAGVRQPKSGIFGAKPKERP